MNFVDYQSCPYHLAILQHTRPDKSAKSDLAKLMNFLFTISKIRNLEEFGRAQRKLHRQKEEW